MAQPIKRFLWWPESQGRDLHVVPGSKTRDLRPDLRVVFADNSNDEVKVLLGASSGAKLTFQPLYNGVVAGSQYNSVGLALSWSVDMDTGVVQVGTAAPVPLAPVVSSFLIEARLTVPGRTEPYIQAIRVQVHRAVQQVWLTPPVLIVPIGTTPTTEPAPRFSVRTEFTDGIVGDVTLDHGVTWTAAPSGRVSASGGLHVVSGDSAGDEIPITATLPAILGGQTTLPAKMRVAQAWTLVPPRATLMVGGNTPSAAVPPEASPNVLFVSGGFTDPQRPLFESYVDLVVDRLRRSKLTRPYDLLAGSINFWRIFLPSPVAGISCRDEVSTSLAGGQTIATPLPAGRRPPHTGPWTRGHLVYVVGYPVLNNGDGSKAAQRLRDDWQASLSNEPAVGTQIPAMPWSSMVSDPNVVSNAVIAEWQALAIRSIIDEVDGGFASVSMGVPPTASAGAEALLGVHPERGGRAALNDFFFALQADDGMTLKDGRGIGHLWRRPTDPAFAFDNTALIVVVSSYPGGRPLNRGRTMVLGTNPQTDVLPVTPVAGRNSLTLVPLATPGVSSEVPHVVAHELAHSFGLGDEYQEFEGRHPQLLDSDLDTFGNLQFETAVRTGRTGPLRSELIKWNWHRIQKAVVVAGPISAEASGTQFRVPVAPIDGFVFEPGERVLLRQRKPREPLGMRPLVALSAVQEAEVVGPLVGGFVLLKAASGSSLAFVHLAPFTPGSVLYLPTPAPASAKSPSYPYAELVAKNIRDYIDGDKPLTALPCTFDETSIVAPIIPGVTVRSDMCRLCTPLIVGLYSGGARYSCGVFHPTGHCVMAPGDGAEFKSFCPVCRYILVEFINPQFHAAIDVDYEEIYPQP